MKAKQRCRPPIGEHRCLVLYTFLSFSVFSPFAFAKQGDALEDYAEVYIDQYFEPDEKLKLSKAGQRKSQALAYYALGKTYEAKGRMGEAVKAYRQVLVNQPGQHFLAQKTAYLLARNGDNEDALKLLEENLENNPDEAMAHIALSDYLATYQANDPEGRRRALDIMEAAAEKFPDEPMVYEQLVKLLVASNRRDDARVIVEQAAASDSEDADYWLALGAIIGRTWPMRPNAPSRDGELLNRVYGKALELAREDWDTVERVGDFYHASRQFPGAVEAYKTVIENNPDQLVTREKLARVYAAMGDEEQMLATLKGIAEIDPQNSAVLKQIAGVYIRRQDYGAAVPYLQESLAIAKGRKEEYSAVGEMLIQQDQHEAAVEFLEDAAYLFPEAAEFPFLLTYALSRQEDWKGALKQFEKTLELGQDSKPEMFDESFYFRFAAAHERAGQIEEAEQLFQKSIELLAKLEPNEEVEEFTATVYNYLGYMWLEHDMNIEEAGELIKTASELDPQSEAIADSLGWYYFKKKDYEKARDELLRAEELMGEPGEGEAEILDHIGQVYEKLGDRETAEEYFQRAVDLDPENSDYLRRLESLKNEKPAKKAAPASDKKKAPKSKKKDETPQPVA